MSNLTSQIGQIWDFLRSVSVHFGSNLTHFRGQFEIPAFNKSSDFTENCPATGHRSADDWQTGQATGDVVCRTVSPRVSPHLHQGHTSGGTHAVLQDHHPGDTGSWEELPVECSRPEVSHRQVRHSWPTYLGCEGGVHKWAVAVALLYWRN